MIKTFKDKKPQHLCIHLLIDSGNFRAICNASWSRPQGPGTPVSPLTSKQKYWLEINDRYMTEENTDDDNDVMLYQHEPSWWSVSK